MHSSHPCQGSREAWPGMDFMHRNDETGESRGQWGRVAGEGPPHDEISSPPSANGAIHTSLGRRPRAPIETELEGLKVRSMAMEGSPIVPGCELAIRHFTVTGMPLCLALASQFRTTPLGIPSAKTSASASGKSCRTGSITRCLMMASSPPSADPPPVRGASRP